MYSISYLQIFNPYLRESIKHPS